VGVGGHTPGDTPFLWFLSYLRDCAPTLLKGRQNERIDRQIEKDILKMAEYRKKNYFSRLRKRKECFSLV
jgi:hypothetical protein